MRVVVDACVAGAAGPSTVEPAPSNVAILNALLQRCRTHHDLMIRWNSRLDQEWQNSGSHFAMLWLYSVVNERFLERSDDQWPELSALLAAVVANHRAPIQKDEHLLHLSMTSDRRLITGEVKLPRYLRAGLKRPICPSSLGALHIVNPISPSACAWVDAGLPDEPAYQLAKP